MEIQSLYSHFLRSTGVTTDSRVCPEGSMFFALHGERFDGNAYARQALAAGCAFAVVDNPDYFDACDERMLFVPDTLKALQALARHHRRQLGTPIVGVTGTNGKTTTKELLYAVLSRRYRTHCTRGNLNNAIGVPLTLLQLTADHEMAVVEMGASHPGDIRELVEIAEPDCGLITNVGRAHLQGFGSFEGVVRTKGELYDYLRTKEGSVVFIHADNPHLTAIADGLRLVRYGSHGDALAVSGRVTACNPYLQFCWTAEGEPEHAVATQLVGSYNVDNALAAICVGRHFGVPAADIDAAIAAYAPSNSRSQLLRTERNTLIVDAYNANPTSMTAALQGFAGMEAEQKWVIVGDMKELGAASDDEHQGIVRLLAASGFQRIWLVGANFAAAFGQVCEADRDINASLFTLFPDADAVAQQLQAEPAEGYTVLIKGSNSMKLAPLSKLL